MVCDIIPGYPAGAAVSTIRFAERLRDNGHHVILIVAKDSKKPGVHAYNGIPIYSYFSIPVPGSNHHYFQSFPTKRSLEELFIREKIQIVHVMFPSYLCFIAKKAARKLGLGLVAHLHAQPQSIEIFLPRILQTSFVSNLLFRYIIGFIRDSDYILSPSEFGKDLYTRNKYSPAITVISNGIDLTIFNKGAIADSTQSTQEDSTVMLYVGRQSKEKDPATIIRAMPTLIRNLPSLMVRMVGIGPMEQELVELSKSLGVESHICFLGRVSDSQLLKEYLGASLFVFPSLVELEGMAVLEAMAYGLPLLIANSPTSASPYFIRGNGLLFAPGDENDLALKALTILKDKKLRIQMSNTSLELVQGYAIERSVKKLEDVYYSVAASPRRKELAERVF